MASIRVTEILAAVRAGSPDGSAMAGGLVHACARSLPVSGVGLALRTAKGPAGTSPRDPLRRPWTASGRPQLD